MADAEKVVEQFLGPDGEEMIRKAKVLISSGYNILDKGRKALDAANELVDAISHARNNVAEGYNRTKTFLAPGVLGKLTDLYEKVKKFGILNILEDMVKKNARQ